MIPARERRKAPPGRGQPWVRNGREGRSQVAEVTRKVRALAGGLEGERRGRGGLDMRMGNG